MSRVPALPITLALALVLGGCASGPYVYGEGLEGPHTLLLREGEPQVERGRPHAVVDGLGHYLFSLPTKLLLLDWKVDNHDVSPETEAAIRQYLADNELDNVKVRINQYAPGDEWRRLVANRDVSGLWRYTIGSLSVALYTVLPQRLFGGDNYNPFTNTIHLYSDRRAIALHEGGHAKDFAGRSRFGKGLYAGMRLLPLLPLVQEAAATGDALAYEREQGGSEDEKRAYRTLYPAYGTYVGGEAVRWVTTGSAGVFYAIQYGPVIPGHLVGWARSLLVDDRDRPDPVRDAVPDALESLGSEPLGSVSAGPDASALDLDSVGE